MITIDIDTPFAHRLRVLLHAEVKFFPFQNPARWVGFFYVTPLPQTEKGTRQSPACLQMRLRCFPAATACCWYSSVISIIKTSKIFFYVSQTRNQSISVLVTYFLFVLF